MLESTGYVPSNVTRWLSRARRSIDALVVLEARSIETCLLVVIMQKDCYYLIEAPLLYVMQHYFITREVWNAYRSNVVQVIVVRGLNAPFLLSITGTYCGSSYEVPEYAR